MSQPVRFLGSAKLIACCTLLSRFTGLARDIFLNRIYGQGWVQDAFNYGFLIPNLFRRLFGEGALSAVFVPVFTEVLDKDGRPAAWNLLARVTGLLALALILLTVILELIALAVWHFSSSGMSSLQAGLTALMLPFMISTCVLALFSSILNCLQHFTVPALLPIVLNIMMILGTLVVGPMLGDDLAVQVYGLAACVLATSIIQLILILPVLRAHGVRLGWSLNRRDPDVRRILRMFLPVLLGQSVLLLNIFFDTHICAYLTRSPDRHESFALFGHSIAYPLTEGALSAINNAQRLYQFPLGVLAISLATAAFPLFSLHASRKDYPALRDTLGQSMRIAVFEGLPCGIVLIVLAEPIIALLFQHGRFDAADTARSAHVLRFYGIGMAAFCSQHILLRGFYSIKDTLTPMWISCALVLLNVLLNVSLVWHPSIREAAFGISTTVTSILHVVISTILLRRRLAGRIGARALLGSLARTCFCTLLSGLAAYAALHSLGARSSAAPDSAFFSRALLVLLPLAAAILTYLVAARSLRMEELRLLLGSVRRKPPMPFGAEHC